MPGLQETVVEVAHSHWKISSCLTCLVVTVVVFRDVIAVGHYCLPHFLKMADVISLIACRDVIAV